MKQAVISGSGCIVDVDVMDITCPLVEQNNDLFYLIQRYWQEAGLRVIVASGLEAVELAVILLGCDRPGQKAGVVLRALPILKPASATSISTNPLKPKRSRGYGTIFHANARGGRPACATQRRGYYEP